MNQHSKRDRLETRQARCTKSRFGGSNVIRHDKVKSILIFDLSIQVVCVFNIPE